MDKQKGDPGSIFMRSFARTNHQSGGGAGSMSTAAAATIQQTKAASQSYGSLLAPPQVCIRTARREDIPAIEACNLKTLPENYPNAFYHNHLLQWPYLALVAEKRPVNTNSHNNNNSENGDGSSSRNNGQEKKIVGYVLGRVDDGGGGQAPYSDSRLPGIVVGGSNTRKTGHVSSLAVLDEYRRLGIGKELMDILHVQMKFRYGVDCSTLHVRCSNRGAQKLYVDSLGYRIVDTVHKYYQDGADAYYMQLDFQNAEESVARTVVEGNGASQSSISLREKEEAVLTQDSNGYFQLYQHSTTTSNRQQISSTSRSLSSSSAPLPSGTNAPAAAASA